MEITRSGILRDCLEETNREMHKYSRHGNGLLPLEGYENHFADLSAKCAMLRAMILEAESREEQVKSDEPRASREVQTLARWQLEVMNGENPLSEDWPKNPLEPVPIPPLMDSDQTYGGNPVNPNWDPAMAFMTPDEALLRRRYRQAEGFKPAPVVYPGGEE